MTAISERSIACSTVFATAHPAGTMKTRLTLLNAARQRNPERRPYPMIDSAHGRFRDRRHGGRELATLLSRYRDRTDVIVLALPRGGVPVGFEVATALR